MNMKSSLFLGFLASVAVGAFADIVNPSGDLTGATDSAAIQSALNGAEAGDKVTLGEGTFYISTQLSVNSAKTLEGQGWEKTVIRQTATSSTHSDTTRCVLLDGGAKLVGVTLTGGDAYRAAGGGAWVKDGTISWCCISNNITSSGSNYAGAGVSFSSGKGKIDHSIVAGNTLKAGWGGGIGAENPTGDILIDTCLVYGNVDSAGSGGGVAIDKTTKTTTIRNSTVVGNRGTYNAGGIYSNNGSGGKLVLVNDIVANNKQSSNDANLFISTSHFDSGNSSNCLVYPSKTSGGGYTKDADVVSALSGKGGLSSDPGFADAVNNDYHLGKDSPAIHAGVTSASIGTDLDGCSFAATPSIGCYEFVASTTVEKPVFAPAACAFTSPIDVTLSCGTEDATIRYTIDGEDPSEASAVYAEPIEIAETTATVKARAYKEGLAPSEIVSATYTYEPPVPPAFGAVTVTPKPRRATIAGAIATVGNDGATSCDVYLAYGTDAENLPAATKVAAGATDSFKCVIAGLDSETTYYYALSISNDAVTVRGAATGGSFETPSMSSVIEPAETATENWEAIQDAIDAAATETVPGTVTLSAGTFLIDAQLMVTGGVALVGQGWTNTVVKQTVSGQRCLTVKDGSRLEGVTLTGGKTTASWTHGAGVSVEDGTVSWCCISNNVATAYNIYGVGVSIVKGSVDHSVIAFNRGNNSGTGGGIGAYNAGGPVTIDACLIYGNSLQGGDGGGVGFNLGNPKVTICNTTITDNSSLNEGGGLKFSTSRLNLVNSIVTRNRMGETEDNLSGTLHADSSNNLIGGDPRFKDAASRDYSLTANSPAKGTGKTYEGIGTDLAGASFANPPSVGCYEYVSSLTAVENPLFDPETGAAFSTPMGVKLVCGTDGATIYYTTDGSDPSELSEVYAGPVVVSETTTVRAFAAKAGMDPSEIVSATYAYEDPVPPSLGPVTVTPKWRKATFSGTITAVGNDWATACDVYIAYGTDEQNLTNGTKVATGATDAFAFTVRGLKPETAYYYALSISNDAATVRGAATSGSFTTEPDPGDLTPVVGDPAATRQLIQEAVEDAAALSSTGTVVLAEGLFEIDTQLTVDGGVTLVGQGWDKTILRQTSSGANSRVVQLNGGATVRKVTLTGGRVNGGNNQYGGGALVTDGTISWCCITNNTLTGGNGKYGGGVCFFEGCGQVDHSIIADNRVDAGTGTAVLGGGIGVYKAYGEISVDTCLVVGNRSVYTGGHTGRGGGIGVEFLYCNNPVTIRNTTVVGNVAGEEGTEVASEGAAVYTSNDASKRLRMVNCIFADNTTMNTNLTVQLSSTTGVDYCLFDVAEDKLGEHSLVGAPHFKNAAAGNYRLAAESPARHAGVREAGVDRDLDGVPFARKPAMGCYELTGGFMLLVR